MTPFRARRAIGIKSSTMERWLSRCSVQRGYCALACKGCADLPRGGSSEEVEHREERQKVMVRARMRSGVSWHDVCVLNLSPHGIGIQAPEPPERGSYVRSAGASRPLSRVSSGRRGIALAFDRRTSSSSPHS